MVAPDTSPRMLLFNSIFDLDITAMKMPFKSRIKIYSSFVI